MSATNLHIILDGVRKEIPPGSPLHAFADAIERMTWEHAEMLAMLKQAVAEGWGEADLDTAPLAFVRDAEVLIRKVES